LGTAFVLAVTAGCGGNRQGGSTRGSGPNDFAIAHRAAAIISAPAGTGNYCSVSYPNGTWGFAYYQFGEGDPCDDLGSQGEGVTLERKGLYDGEGVNNVVVRCQNGPSEYVKTYSGVGNWPLAAAKSAAQGNSSCVFTVSAKKLPIFKSPFSLNAKYGHGTGYDFAKPPYKVLDVAEFGQSGSGSATYVDWLGRDRSPPSPPPEGWYIDDHDGHDWGMATGEEIRAVADGYVMVARDWQSPEKCGGDVQKEVFILHTIFGPSPGPNTYYEDFVSFYAHFKSYDVKEGDIVSQGQVIGESGMSGCADGEHLHLSVLRLTNTASQRIAKLEVYDGPDMHSNGWQMAIEPYGFDPPTGFDPWGWKAYPFGALSVDLWKPGESPELGDW
jgi:murein DD-endopeptidase MepM/ murein hydrolase activator NlpD